jgi:acyl-coenzyme A synthetase/AMP-(fatty) acid ligase
VSGTAPARSSITAVLLQHPDTVQAHVVGVPDQSKGELLDLQRRDIDAAGLDHLLRKPRHRVLVPENTLA